MKKVGHVRAVLTGKAQPYARGSVSAIDKHIVTERQNVTELGFDNDEQGDPRFHGGVEKALHIYPSEHYPLWVEALGDKSVFQSVGAFGENLSSVGLSEATVCVEDIYKIGTTLVQVSQGRMPCWKLNERCQYPEMAKQLQDTLRTGWYFRVLETGTIGAGDDIILCERPYPDWTLARVMGLIFTGCLDKQKLTELSKIPLVNSWQALVQKRLMTGELENWSFRLYGSIN